MEAVWRYFKVRLRCVCILAYAYTTGVDLLLFCNCQPSGSVAWLLEIHSPSQIACWFQCPTPSRMAGAVAVLYLSSDTSLPYLLSLPELCVSSQAATSENQQENKEG